MVTTANDSDAYTLEQSGGKTSLELRVDNYSGSSQTIAELYSMQLGSYLRLGAVPDRIVSKYAQIALHDNASEVFGPGDADGEDLASKVTTFVDDSRTRGDSILSANARANETAVLHRRGGWRDHTDGNRITTTRGDKVEVIVGNYKMIVMGRRQWAAAEPSANTDAARQTAWDSDASLHLESSGGITYHYDQVPGQVVDVTWDNTNGIYQVKEETHKGHFVNRYEGVDKDWDYGPEKRTRVGSLAAYNYAVSNSALHPLPSYDKSDTSATLGEFGSDDDFDKAADEAHTNSVAWPPTDDYLGTEASSFKGYAPSVVSDTFARAIVEHTWARQIVDFTGSTDRPVPSIVDHDYLENFVEDIYVGKWDDETVINKHSGRSDQSKHESLIRDDTSGEGIVVNRYGSYLGMFGGLATESWGLQESGYYRITNFQEQFWPFFESIRMGLAVTSFVGFDIAARTAAAVFDVYVLQACWDVLWGGKVELNLGCWENTVHLCEHQEFEPIGLDLTALFKKRASLSNRN